MPKKIKEKFIKEKDWKRSEIYDKYRIAIEIQSDKTYKSVSSSAKRRKREWAKTLKKMSKEEIIKRLSEIKEEKELEPTPFIKRQEEIIEDTEGLYRDLFGEVWESWQIFRKN